MTLSTLAAGMIIIGFATLLELNNKDYEKEKEVFEKA